MIYLVVSQPCVYGDTSAQTSVALFGDSYAGVWFPALDEISSAMRAHPELVAATTGRVDTELMRVNPALVAKSGAEGYFCVGHVSGQGIVMGEPGLGDGATGKVVVS